MIHTYRVVTSQGTWYGVAAGHYSAAYIAWVDGFRGIVIQIDVVPTMVQMGGR